MKKLILTAIISLVPLTTLFASGVFLPTGQFEYSKSEVTHLRDVRFFSVATEEDTREYKRLKKLGYVCREFPADMVRCYKFLENQGSIEIPLEEVVALTPNFGESYSSQVISRSSYLIILQVIQVVQTPYGIVPGYEVHVREGGGLFMEITLHNEPFYYQFSEENLETVYLRRSYRKRTGDNSYLEYGVRSIYLKL